MDVENDWSRVECEFGNSPVGAMDELYGRVLTLPFLPYLQHLQRDMLNLSSENSFRKIFKLLT